MKKTIYFSHDCGARNDEKIIKLIQIETWSGYGLFWAIIEKLYESNGYLDRDYECIAFDLRTEYERIKNVIENYNLFVLEETRFYSKSVLERIEKITEKSEKARESIMNRWNNTNVLRTNDKRNTIKENKTKENKIKQKEIKENNNNSIAEASSATQVIPNLLLDKQKHIQVIGLYARAKGINFESIEQQRSFIKRNLRASQSLSTYSAQKIADTMKYLIDNANFKWTIESVGKFIDEDLTTLNNKNKVLDLSNIK